MKQHKNKQIQTPHIERPGTWLVWVYKPLQARFTFCGSKKKNHKQFEHETRSGGTGSKKTCCLGLLKKASHQMLTPSMPLTPDRGGTPSDVGFNGKRRPLPIGHSSKILRISGADFLSGSTIEDGARWCQIEIDDRKMLVRRR